MKISIVIPTKNRSHDLKNFLGSLLRQSYKNFEVIIVDGGSKDGTLEMLDQYREKFNLTVIVKKVDHDAKAQNAGLKAVKGDIFLRTDDDVMVNPKWLESIVTTFKLSENIGGVTGPTIIPEKRRRQRDLFYFQEEKFKSSSPLWWVIGKLYFYCFMESQPRALGKWFRSGAFSVGSNYPSCLRVNGMIEVENLEACNMAVRTTVLREIGCFDEGFGHEHSEADIAFRVRKKGYKIMFNPHGVVYHLVSPVFSKIRANTQGRIHDFIRFYYKHIKPDTLDKKVRFLLYLIFLNGYWLYKSINERHIRYLTSFSSTVKAVAAYAFCKEIPLMLEG